MCLSASSLCAHVMALMLHLSQAWGSVGLSPVLPGSGLLSLNLASQRTLQGVPSLTASGSCPLTPGLNPPTCWSSWSLTATCCPAPCSPSPQRHLRHHTSSHRRSFCPRSSRPNRPSWGLHSICFTHSSQPQRTQPFPALIMLVLGSTFTFSLPDPRQPGEWRN